MANQGEARKQRPKSSGCFALWRSLRRFEKQDFPFMESAEDRDVLIEIGYHQEIRQALTMSGLLSLRIGAEATIERRVRRLKQLGVVVQEFHPTDKRQRLLLLSDECRQRYGRSVRLLRELSNACSGSRTARLWPS